MESALEALGELRRGVLDRDGTQLIRLKPHASATHLVVRRVDREVALPVRFHVEMKHLFQRLNSDQHHWSSILWMKD